MAKRRVSRRKVTPTDTPSSTSSPLSPLSIPTPSSSSTPSPDPLKDSRDSFGLDISEEQNFDDFGEGDDLIDGDKLIELIENEETQELKDLEEKMKKEIEAQFKKKEEEIYGMLDEMKTETEQLVRESMARSTKKKEKKKQRESSLFDLFGLETNFEDFSNKQFEDIERQAAEAEAQMQEALLKLEEAEKRMQEMSAKMVTVEQEVEIKIEQYKSQPQTLKAVSVAPARIRTYSKKDKEDESSKENFDVSPTILKAQEALDRRKTLFVSGQIN